jgi:2-polyprenyl-3-methyl-5-hydroxy-6-metoxy-1,4-benzoquinol methylase
MATSASDARRRCPLCGKDHFPPWRFGLLRCESCRLVLSPAIWQTEVNERMEDEWFGEGYEQRKSSIWVEWFEARNNRRTLSRLANLALPGKRLLEIGVGSGSFLRAARDAGFDVMGCDLSAPICRQAEQTHGVAMHCGPLDSLPGQARFDVVVMNHVLEHVQNPVMFLQEVRRLLAPQGIVHVAVPNIACWEAKLSGWTSYEPYHLTYFDRATLQRAIGAAELQAISVATHESFSGWFLALLRTAIGANRVEGAVVRQRTPVYGSDKRRPRPATVEHVYRAAMTIFGGALWPLRRLQGYWGWGDELVCIAKLSGGGSR